MQFSRNQIDELCSRRCAFALYRLPGCGVKFCMAADGSCRGEAPQGVGFVISTFSGETSYISAELSRPPSAALFERLPQTPPDSPATSRREYALNFQRFRAPLLGESPTLQKLVLARTCDVAVSNLSPTAAFERACTLYDNTLTVLFHTPRLGTWLFSTPELLLEGQDSSWQTMALAGTRLISHSPWDEKNIREQKIVSDFVRSTLSRHASELDEEPICNLPNGVVEHLCTRFRFRMSAEHLPSLLQELPPTPAVCGYPLQKARKFLQESPDIDRSCYSGYFGPIDKSSARLYVALRGMRLFPGVCRLYAGGGIMPDSEEESEWSETEHKLQSMLRVLKPRG